MHKGYAWIRTPEVKAVLTAIQAGGQEARFVGGCVRDALLGKPIVDIDIATPEKPEKVIKLLEKAGLKAVPTGIQHGTITAVANHRPFEITTLRKDVETDGRHAKVVFTDQWEEDAARRDLTINAMYLSPQEELFDYHGGQEDLRDGHIRFIGNAEQRILEDVLRILRFFRFYAWYGDGNLEKAGLAACAKHAVKIADLSGERIHREMSKLLMSPNPVPALKAMQETKVLSEVIPGTITLEVLQRLPHVEHIAEYGPEFARRLAGLVDLKQSQNVAERWKLSNAEKERLHSIVSLPAISLKMTPLEYKRLIRRWGKEHFIDRLLLQWADESRPPVNQYEAIVKLCREWEIPELPVSGKDLLAMGWKPGVALGKCLEKLEAEWETSEYRLSRKALLDQAKP